MLVNALTISMDGVMTTPRDTCRHIGYCGLARDEAGYSPELARIIRTRWCRNDYASCARYHVARALGPEAVPVDFFPAELERAQTLISANAE